jgi:hypothetical protein
MSPFTHADKINKPLLLIHGEADNNTGGRLGPDASRSGSVSSRHDAWTNLQSPIC